MRQIPPDYFSFQIYSGTENVPAARRRKAARKMPWENLKQLSVAKQAEIHFLVV